MRKVLILSYYFPPMGMGGVQRTAKFVKYLPQFGWKPYVITVKDILYYAYDETLNNELNDALVFRTESLDVLRLKNIYSSLFKTSPGLNQLSFQASFMSSVYQAMNRWFFIPDGKNLWIPFAFRKAIRLIKEENIRYVITSSPPNSVHLTALMLKKFMNIKWLVDFRDAWSNNPFNRYPTFAHSKLNQYLESKVIKYADGVTGVSQEIINTLQKRTTKAEEKFQVIPNGFDPDDFPEKVVKNKQLFLIIYIGTFNYISNPNNFLLALQQAAAQEPGFKESVKFIHIGATTDFSFKEMITRLGLNQIVYSFGYLPHRKSIEFMMHADLLLFTLSEKATPGIITGKIFEYLASGTPILCVSPRIEISSMIEKLSRSSICAPNDVSCILKNLIKEYSRWKKQNELSEPVHAMKEFHFDDELLPYTRKNITSKLAEHLDRL